jgi:hypothetical protein
MAFTRQQVGSQHRVDMGVLGIYFGQRTGPNNLTLRRHARIENPETPSVIRWDGKKYHVEVLGAPQGAGSTFDTLKDIENAFGKIAKGRKKVS